LIEVGVDPTPELLCVDGDGAGERSGDDGGRNEPARADRDELADGHAVA